MKRRVKVTLAGTVEIEMDVEAGDDEDPTDLTPQERQRAISEAFMTGDAEWEVESVDLVEP